ncbi:MAG: hypothetical protein ACI89G_001906, partial [Minisyncoccia bacterium]
GKAAKIGHLHLEYRSTRQLLLHDGPLGVRALAGPVTTRLPPGFIRSKMLRRVGARTGRHLRDQIEANPVPARAR